MPDTPAGTPTPPPTTTDDSNSDRPALTLVRHPLVMRRLTVAEVTRPTPRLVRVALGGDDLDGFRSDGPADHVKVFFPPAGETEPALPRLGPDGIESGQALPRTARDYTPRHHRLADGLLELDLVVHDGGLASGWAEQARPGQWLGVAGPRGSHVPTGRFTSLVLAGDETALPAMANWLRWAPAGLAVTVVAEVADAHDHQDLSAGTAAALDLRWAHRGDAPLADGTALVDAVAALPDVEPTLGPGTFWWVAGETAVVQRIRRHLLDDRGVEADLVSSRGYWKQGAADHQEPHAD